MDFNHITVQGVDSVNYIALYAIMYSGQDIWIEIISDILIPEHVTRVII